MPRLLHFPELGVHRSGRTQVAFHEHKRPNPDLPERERPITDAALSQQLSHRSFTCFDPRQRQVWIKQFVVRRKPERVATGFNLPMQCRQLACCVTLTPLFGRSHPENPWFLQIRERLKSIERDLDGWVRPAYDGHGLTHGIEELFVRISQKPDREMKGIWLPPRDADIFGKRPCELLFEIMLDLQDARSDIVADLDGKECSYHVLPLLTNHRRSISRAA